MKWSEVKIQECNERVTFTKNKKKYDIHYTEIIKYQKIVNLWYDVIVFLFDILFKKKKHKIII